MSFVEAIKEMRKGKRIGRRVWDGYYYAEIGKNHCNFDSIVFLNDDGDEVLIELSLDDFEAEDWEVAP
jgi:hypothetical protein